MGPPTNPVRFTLAKMKVGDRVDIVWTEAILVSLDRDQ
jgi:hypothetical protein